MRLQNFTHITNLNRKKNVIYSFCLQNSHLSATLLINRKKIKLSIQPRLNKKTEGSDYLMSKIPSSCKILWLAIKQHDLMMIYINFITGALVTELIPQGIWGGRLSHVCVSHYRKMRTRRELEPKVPKPASPSALGPNSNSSQHPATVTFSPIDVHVETRWPPILGAVLATVQRAFSQDQEAHFSSGSFTMSLFRSGQQGHLLCNPWCFRQPPTPSCWAPPQVRPYPCCHPSKKLCYFGNPLLWV